MNEPDEIDQALFDAFGRRQSTVSVDPPDVWVVVEGHVRRRRRRRQGIGAGLALVALAVVALGLTVRGGDDGSASVSVIDAPVTQPVLAPWCDEVAKPGPVAETNPPSANGDLLVMSIIERYATGHPDTYAGIWIDRVHGGTIVAGFTDDPAPHRAAIAASMALPEDPYGIAKPDGWTTPVTPVGESDVVFDVVQVANSAEDLKALQEQTTRLFTDASVQLASVGTKTDINRLAIMVAQDVTDDVRQVVAERLPVDAVCMDGGPPVEPYYQAPSNLIPAEGSDPWITCGDGSPFRLSAFEDPAKYDPADPMWQAFVAQKDVWSHAYGLPAEVTDWRLLLQTDDRAMLIKGDPVTGLVSLDREDGVWIVSSGSSGPCELRALLPEGLTAVEWYLDPRFPTPQTGDTSLHLIVSGVACSGGAPVGDRLVDPEVVVRGDQLLIGIAAEDLGGGFHTCQGNRPEEYELVLPEPLGTQVIADGTYLPPRTIGPPPGS